MATVQNNPMILSGPPATIDDLYRVEGKAELIDGRIVHFMSSGIQPAEVALTIALYLREFAKLSGHGKGVGDGLGYAIRPPLRSRRQSFSPDASYYAGPLPSNLMRFIEGPPTLAVEVRSEGDYGPAAEREMAEKRADYFEAGTLVVWDVDPVARTIASYRAATPSQAVMFRTGDTADAEPAVPGWTISVDAVFSGV
jgi:Uma2 family endonuclease